MIGISVPISARAKNRVTLQNPGPAVPNGDGGYTQTWTDLVPPSVSAQILPATQADLERVGANTVTSTATHIVKIPFHPEVTTKTRLLFDGRRFEVTGVADPEELNAELWLVCAEVVQ